MDCTRKKILVVSHVTDLSGPTEALAAYLEKKAGLFGLVCHPFYYCSDRRSRGTLYKEGKAVLEQRLAGAALPEVFTFFKDVLMTFYFLLKFRTRFDIYVGVDPLNACIGIFLRKLGLAGLVIFYTIDWMPKRFTSRLLNRIYHSIDRACVKGCDKAWNISPRIMRVRREQGLPEAKNMLVPVGVEAEKIELPPAEEILRDGVNLALLGALAPSKGVDLVMEAYPRIREKCPGLKLTVIGKTPEDPVENGKRYQPYEPRLKALGDSVRLLGPKPHDEVLRILPRCGIGLALYAPDTIELSRWADPSRVKDYLACGLPVIITDVPEIAREIHSAGAGLLINYSAEELVNAVHLLCTDSGKFTRMRENAIRYMKDYGWQNIFDRAFADPVL